MHLLVRETHSLDEADAAVDLQHPPADLVVLSFSDADLGALTTGAKNLRLSPRERGRADDHLAIGYQRDPSPSPALEGRGMDCVAEVRLASLGRLRHPLSVDLYVENTLGHARCVVIRLLGGLDYWRYGAEQVAALCRERGIALAVLPGDGRDDPALAALSTVGEASYRRLDACFRHGGPENMRRALRVMAHLAGLAPEPLEEPTPLPQHGVHRLDLDARPLAALVFYRSHWLAGDVAPVDALIEALHARGLAVGAVFVGSLKAPETAAWVARTLSAWRPAVVLNATGFFGRETPGRRWTRRVHQCCRWSWAAAGGRRGRRRAGASRRLISRCKWYCRNWTAGS